MGGGGSLLTEIMLQPPPILLAMTLELVVSVITIFDQPYNASVFRRVPWRQRRRTLACSRGVQIAQAETLELGVTITPICQCLSCSQWTSLWKLTAH